MNRDMIETGFGGDTHLIAFDDLPEMIEQVTRTNVGHELETDSVFSDVNFIGREFRDWRHLIAEGRKTWGEGMELFDRCMSQLQDKMLPRPTNVRRTPTYRDDDGDEICLDRLQQNQPFWRTTQRSRRVAKRAVTIVTNVVTPAQRASSEVVWRGIAAVALCDRLEAAGYAVEIIAVESTKTAFTSGRGLWLTVPLKQPDDPLDTATIVTALSGWYYRTIWFRCGCLVGDEQLVFSLGLAFSCESDLSQITPDRTVIYVDKIFDEAAAVQFVSERIDAVEAVAV